MVKSRINKTLLYLGINAKIILSFRNIFKYIKSANEFIRKGGEISSYVPILSDYNEQSGFASGHYFHQDLFVARLIYEHKPIRHIDIGSRVDGFVAHVASFRTIEVMDVRDLKVPAHSNITFIKADLMKDAANDSLCDSISCLHAIEHFGLGRYGDPVDPIGHIKGFENMIRMLKENGRLYISFPIASKNRIEFNAHRVFLPNDIFEWSKMMNKLKLIQFNYVGDNGDLNVNIDCNLPIVNLEYGCGIYVFEKLCN